MRILQICPAFYPANSIGGPIFTILSLQSILVEKGNTVDVLATPLGLSADVVASIVLNRPLPMPLPKRLNGKANGKIVYVKYWGYPHFTFSPMSLYWLIRNIARYDVAVLHGIWNFPILAASIACRCFRVPYIIFPHGTLYKETVELRSRRKKLIIFRLFGSAMLKAAKRVIFTTLDEQSKVTKYLGNIFRPFIMPNIVPSSNFSDSLPHGGFREKYGISRDSLVMIHYGRITRKKGLEHSIHALSLLCAEFPQLVFVVVGGDDEGYQAELERQARALDVFDKVIFTGILDQEHGKVALIDSDIFVLPSLSENFGMAVVEAMLCKLPVVISNNVGIAPEIGVARAGLVIELAPKNESLVVAISILLRDPEERHLLGMRGREYAIQRYDVPAVSSRVDELLLELRGDECTER